MGREYNVDEILEEVRRKRSAQGQQPEAGQGSYTSRRPAPAPQPRESAPPSTAGLSSLQEERYEWEQGPQHLDETARSEPRVRERRPVQRASRKPIQRENADWEQETSTVSRRGHSRERVREPREQTARRPEPEFPPSFDLPEDPMPSQ